MEENLPKYQKDKNSTLTIRVNKAKKAKYKSIVTDVSKGINAHIDETIEKDAQERA